MFGNVTALEGSHATEKYRDEKQAAHMLQACGLGSSHLRRPVSRSLGLSLGSSTHSPYLSLSHTHTVQTTSVLGGRVADYSPWPRATP